MIWNNITELESKDFKCGYCAKEIASKEGFKATTERRNQRTGKYFTVDGLIYICHYCEFPTFFDNEGYQFPGEVFGEKINFIPDPLVSELYEEARKCHSFNAFNSSVMLCRKVLMNLSVSEGADEGLSFQKYIDYLEQNGFIPPNGRKWVDLIRKLGNSANHKIEHKTEKDSKLILHFTGMLLKFIYEMPGLLEDSLE